MWQTGTSQRKAQCDTVIPSAGKCAGAIIDTHEHVLYIYFFQIARLAFRFGFVISVHILALYPIVSMFAYNRRGILQQSSVIHP